MKSNYTYVGNRHCRYCEHAATHLWSYRAHLRGRTQTFYLATCDEHQHAAQIIAAESGKTLTLIGAKDAK